MRSALSAAVALLLMGANASAQQPKLDIGSIMRVLEGTTAVTAYPQFADGKLGSCAFEFNYIGRDTVYRNGTFMKIFGSFGVMEAKGNVAITLKIVVNDINPKTGEIEPSPPANSYFIFGTQSSRAELVGKYPSDTPGAQFSIFKPLPTFEHLSSALDRGQVNIAFNRKDGGMDIVVPIDLTVASTNDVGKREHSQKMITDFYECIGDLMKSAKANASK